MNLADPVKRAERDLAKAEAADATAEANEAASEAALASLKAQPEPENFEDSVSLNERISAAKRRLEVAQGRRRITASNLDAAKADLQKAKRAAARHALESATDKLAREAPTGWDKAIRTVSDLAESLAANAEAVRRFNAEAEALGEPGLQSALTKARPAYRGYYLAHPGPLLDQLCLPSFDPNEPRHWPEPSRIWP